MKRLFAAALAVLLAFSSTIGAFAEDSPLASSDRLTSQLVALQKRKEEIDLMLQQRENAKKAAIYAGKNSSDSKDLSYFINRKIVTKKDYEAFKWSFILSQFAVPLEDTLLDVLAENNMNRMYEENFTVTGVKEYIITDSTDTPSSSLTSEVAMIQDTEIRSLVETMKENYTVYPIFDKNDSQVKFNTLLNPGGLSIFDVFYIKDTLAKSYADSTTNQDSKQASNALFYNQEYIKDASVELETVKLPVFVYDANTYMYLQIAVGAYLKAHGNKAKSELQYLMGDMPLCIDSYGNICVYMDSRALILVPNFGNSFLNSRVGEDADLVESINLYNKWFVTLYSRATRTRNTVYPDVIDIEFPDTVSLQGDAETGKQTLVGDDKPRNLYASHLKVMSDEDLSNTLLLVETSGYTTKPHGGVTGVLEKTGHNIKNFYPFTHFNGDERDTMMGYAALVFDAIRENGQTHLSSYWNEGNFEGIIRSPYNQRLKKYAPFVATSEDQDFYWNKNPLLMANVGVEESELKSVTNSGCEVFSHISRITNSLDIAQWRIKGQTHSALYFSGVTASDANTNTNSLAIASEDILTLITTFTDGQILDNRFASFYKSKSGDSYFNTEVYLPRDIIDVGQTMDAYINDEKGMFLADYRTRYNAGFIVFRKSLEHLCPKLVENLKKFKSASNTSLNVVDTDNITNTGNNTFSTAANTVYINDSTAYLLMYNKTIHEKTDAFQDHTYFTWDMSLENFFTQDKLKFFYEQQAELDNSELSNYITGCFKKVDFYAVYKLTDSGKGNFIGFSSTPISNDATQCTELVDTIYYFSDSNRIYDWFHTYDVSYSIPYADTHTLCPNYDKVIEILKGKYEHPKPDNLKDLLDAIKQQIPKPTDAYHASAVYTAAVASLAVGRLHLWALNPYCTFTELLQDIEVNYNLDANVVADTLMSGFSFKSFYYDSNDNKRIDIYYYDEYLYTLRNPTYLSNKMGYNSANDFSTVTYFWDRHYLMQAAFQQHVMDEMNFNWSGLKDDYEKYLEEVNKNYFDSSKLTLQDYIKSQAKASSSRTLTLTDKDGNKHPASLYVPYYYEWTIQDRNGNPTATVEEQLAQLQLASLENELENFSGAQGKAELEEKIKELSANSPNRVFGSNSGFYNFLDAETIILYPFSRLSDSIDDYSLEVRAGLGDAVIAYAKSTANLRGKDGSKQFVKTDLVATIMALQCNTDYEDNNLAYVPAAASTKTSVTKEELMDNANQFFTNPVTSLSYIFTGFLYQIHSTVATGNIGSVFSINWLLESDVYKWIMNRYIAILAIAVGVVLLLKLIQFAMNRSKSTASIGGSVVGILAMCLVPVAIFNSFVWAFNTSSSWFLHGSLDKILLSQIEVKERERVNNDPGVSAELNAFREQFRALDLGGYDCLTFDEMASYSITNGPEYRQKGIWDYMEEVVYKVTDGKNWYDTNFTAVHANRYKESVFYFFYDYIRAEYFNYCSSHTDGNTAAVTDIITKIQALKDDTTTTDQKEIAKNINVQEMAFANLQGGFKQMLEDTAYVYGDSVIDIYKHKTNGPKAKDLAGMYLLFNNPDISSLVNQSPYYRAWMDSKLMTAKDELIPIRWNSQEYLETFFTAQKTERAKQKGDGYYVITSYHDLFSRKYNDMDTSGMTINDIAVTPLEEKLCAITDDIYNTTLKALNYLPDQIHDESAITLMAMIATCKLNDAFGVAPAEPILQSVTMDSFVRTAFLTNLEEVGSNVNTLYAMISQGDSIGKILVVVFLELIICVASVARVLIILYITVASFVILGLRLLHKAPRTTELVYGIVGNMVALLALHAITLFLVIIAVEAVAGAVSVVPSILLDILMIAFTILMARALFKLVKNIAKDAVNIGGAKIKGMIYSIGNTITKAVQSVTHSNDSTMDSSSVNLSSSQTVYTPEEAAEAAVIQRRTQVSNIVEQLKRVEAQEAEERERAEAEQVDTPEEAAVRYKAGRINRTLAAERQISEQSADEQ